MSLTEDWPGLVLIKGKECPEHAEAPWGFSVSQQKQRAWGQAGKERAPRSWKEAHVFSRIPKTQDVFPGALGSPRY